MRYTAFLLTIVLTAGFATAGALTSIWWWAPLVVLVPGSLLGCWDLLQTRHSLMRNYPLAARLRWLFEEIRPEIRQYFVESDIDGSPFSRNSRALVYERAKNTHEEKPFGTELEVYDLGYEWFVHSIAPRPQSEKPFKVTVGGPDCTQPYDMALLNVSAMSFGALSGNAIGALNKGAWMGGFAHDTGEGGLTKYHLEHGGDLVWEIGSGYFGCRTPEGKFDLETFREKAGHPAVKCISIKLSQGAKPGLGGVMPAAKVTAEVAKFRGVPEGVKCISPPYHTAFDSPRSLLDFVQSLREASGGKPTGFKLCIGRESEFLSVCKAMMEREIYPDFIIIDGSEGGTGAAPQEFEDHVGTPLTEGLHFAHNALVGCGLRERIKIGCSGKVNSSFEMAKRIAQGADYCNAARAMMFAIGCIQAQRCHTNTCPVGVATQDPKRTRALVVEDKAQRVYHFQQNTVADFQKLIAALGLDNPSELDPTMLMKRVTETTTRSYAELYEYLKPHELLTGTAPTRWETVWQQASADRFR